MLAVDIPGFGGLSLEHLVLDYNGTLAVDGALIAGVPERLRRLSANMQVHVITADTRGMARAALTGLPLKLDILAKGAEAEGKLDFVRQLGAHRVAALGNGRNDALMLGEVALGIAVLEKEGLAVDALTSAAAVAPGIEAALDMLLDPLRLTATLRR
ncbi:MAG TPA: ATPase P [Myxococcales bacterium]|jgi:soluble P-type ATPase|nr:ATPase P [Myxococcales bacterium]